MKGILEFDLPEEQDDFEMASNAGKYMVVLHDIDQHLRSRIKYPPENTTESELYALQAIRDKLYELLSDQGIIL